MATIKVEVTYDPKKETLSQALASLLTEKPEHTETNVQMSLFDNPAPTETPAAQTSTEAPPYTGYFISLFLFFHS